MLIEISKNYNLSRLKRWLDIELSASTLLLLSWLWYYTITLAAIAAILFTPFMLKILFEEKKFGWIILFIIIIIIPLIATMFIDEGFMYKFSFAGIILVLFYFYCAVLRFAVRDWMHS